MFRAFYLASYKVSVMDVFHRIRKPCVFQRIGFVSKGQLKTDIFIKDMDCV